MTKLSSDSRLWLVVALAGLVASPGCAEGPPRGGEGPSGGPPQAALDACFGRAMSDYCAFDDGRHSITGTCQERGDDWVCVPDREPPGGYGDQSAGSGSAAVMGGGVGLAASSASRSDGSASGSRPAPPPEAVDACLSLSQGQACTVATSRGEIDGRCAIEGEVVACIPSDPSHRPPGTLSRGDSRL